MALYAFTIALSSFLLFLVQPIVARQILPWFGGSAAVWTTCMMFFQLALLAGYAYSDALTRWLGASRQRAVHGAMLFLSLAFLPIIAGDAWRPDDPGLPVLRIVWLLAAVVGLPYFMLATTGPLLQAWFARQYPQARVYRLYALSNAASMAALIAYPPLIEPAASVSTQALAWSGGYALFALAGLALLLRGAGGAHSSDGRAGPYRQATSPAQELPFTQHTAPAHESTPAQPGEPLSRRTRFAWFGYSALGSVLMLSVTAHLSQNVASVPFLWLLPLTLYLLSFILCFEGRGWYRPGLYLPLAGAACALMAAGLFVHVGSDGRIAVGAMPVVQGLVVHGSGLFVLCMFLHGELAERRPPPALLTRFYLMLALGGAAGGVFVAVLAGLLFDAYLELPIALAAVAAIVLFTAPTERTRLASFVFATLTLTSVTMVVLFSSSGALEVRRNFYGLLSVRKAEAGERGQDRLRLSHGNTVHGEQLLDADARHLPTSYYGDSSGVGRVIGLLQARDDGRLAQRIGVVGLGAGTLAAYGRPGDRYRFYELDPMVADFARRHFTFLADSKAANAVVLGDGRLMLERESPNGFGLLVIDAFSSDSIPMHLLTAEAMRAYLRHVDAGGAVAFHVSNHYVDLRPVVRNLADSVGWRAVVVSDAPAPGRDWLLTSTWVIVSANAALIEALIDGGAAEALADAGVAPWTDSYGNLFDVLRIRR